MSRPIFRGHRRLGGLRTPDRGVSIACRSSGQRFGRSVGSETDGSALEGAADAWGHPDLEGTWTTDDMRVCRCHVRSSSATRAYLTDEEFAARAKQRDTARNIDDARTGTFRNEEGTRDFGYTSMVIDPPDGRVPALTAAAMARRAPGDQGSFGVGTVGQDRGLLAVRPLHHARRDRLVHAGGLRQRRAHHAVARRRRHQLRDDSRHAHHPADGQAADRLEHPAVHGRLPRSLGGRHAGRRVARTSPTGRRSAARHSDGAAHDRAFYARSTRR